MNATAVKVAPTALRMIPWRWIILGAATYLVILLATFPAARLTNRLQAKGVAVAGVSGSIWSGRAAAIQANGIILGATEWHINPWFLLTGKVSADVHSKRDDGYIDGTVHAGFGATVELIGVRASVPISFLSALRLPNGWPNGWSGGIQARLDRVTLVNAWPSRIEGEVSILDLTNLQSQPVLWGSHRVKFGAATSGVAEVPTGTIESLPGGPLELTGSVLLTPTHTFKIDGLAKPTSTASSAIVSGLKRNLIPDTQGRYPVGGEFSSAVL